MRYGETTSGRTSGWCVPFARRIMEGSVDEGLQHYSLGLCPQAGEARQDLGDADPASSSASTWNLTPDLGLINKVLSDLTLYDENVILLVDAESVKDPGAVPAVRPACSSGTITSRSSCASRAAAPELAASAHPAVHGRRNPRPAGGGRAGPAAYACNCWRSRFARRSSRSRRRWSSGRARPDQDNLNLVLHSSTAARPARAWKASAALTEQDVAAAAPSIFHLPDGEQDPPLQRRPWTSSSEVAPFEDAAGPEAGDLHHRRPHEEPRAGRPRRRSARWRLLLPGPTWAWARPS